MADKIWAETLVTRLRLLYPGAEVTNVLIGWQNELDAATGDCLDVAFPSSEFALACVQYTDSAWYLLYIKSSRGLLRSSARVADYVPMDSAKWQIAKQLVRAAQLEWSKQSG